MKKKYIRPSLYVVHIEPEIIIASSLSSNDNMSDYPQLIKPKNYEDDDSDDWD